MIELKTDPKIAAEIAALLLDIKAVKLSTEVPFIWASGWQSPIYCDNRLALGYPEIRSIIKTALANKIQEYFPKCQAIAGVATAGIPQGVLVADALEVPFLYVRSTPKGHGLENQIDGHVVPGQKVLGLEDLISTGGSSLKAVDASRKNQVEILGMAAIFTYGFEVAKQNFADAKVPWFSLSNYHHLIEYAAAHNMVDEEQIQSLQAWRLQPENWRLH